MRPRLTFDGKGINGPDEYRSRVATFENDEAAQEYGKTFAAVPELLAALRAIADRLPDNTDGYSTLGDLLLDLRNDARAALAKAKGA